MQFITNDFMLGNETARYLYDTYAKKMPIFDYHCHLDPQQISENTHFDNITELWLGGDHYKWRAMRAQGIDERYITGDAPPEEKFRKWAEALENAVGNPLYHWSHLELKMYFGIDTLLTTDNADEIYAQANDYLKTHHVTTQSLIQASNVALICTTDHPNDDLKYHEQIKAQQDFKTTVLPAFRPDDLFKVDQPVFKDFVAQLSELTHEVKTAEALMEAVVKRIDYFHEHGGRLADHGLEEVHYAPYTPSQIEMIFQKGLNGESITREEKFQFQTFVLYELSKAYHARQWVMQIHFGAIRNNNTRAYEKLGPDAGFDSIRDQENLAYHLNHTLDMMERDGHLPKTILYNLNPVYNDIVGSTIANFQTEPGIQSKVQHGAGWWFNDTKQGMLRQMSSLADQGLIMHFVGMLTDSRSFISYSRHDYFRRILCTWLGEQVEKGEIPDDAALLKRFVENICYNNAFHYFKLMEEN
ncbi:glucuronate isomerase [Staphylococcus americanisciuri]|uniref:Uronate isomerase n=1 Tax=Staphylococcus americanisciuri TaxID=2973940 RepID=A0ABT2F277_9STAP|nr:glucuronate isomerase [Staphylococcus americanisciuri]MCS4486563.1 glucuronate isomerase [Staphylococcus americanisciuri]